MEYTHVQKNLNFTPRKLRLVADMVRNMTPAQAIEALRFVNKAAAISMSKAIKTAIANTVNKEGLLFKRIEVNEGMKLKRFRSAARGRARSYKRRFAHVKIVLTSGGKG